MAELQELYQEFKESLRETVEFFSDPDNYIDPADCPRPRSAERLGGQR
jgi:hypothetical protein